MSKKKDYVVSTKLNEVDFQNLVRTAEYEEIFTSQLIRKAIKRYLYAKEETK